MSKTHAEKKKISILKRTGEKAEFEREKLQKSLERTGAGNDLVNYVMHEMTSQIKDGSKSKDLQRMAFKLLRKKSRPAAARYQLKKAVMELGPTGFPFERFIARILDHEGYKTEVGVILRGHCVNHEIDVIAAKGEDAFMIECKYHSEYDRPSNVKIPLYIRSRFLDVQEHLKGKEMEPFNQVWVVTNTRFTEDAMLYAKCMGMKLIAWNYPEFGGLKDRIDRSGLYPISCLTTMTNEEKQEFMDRGKVLCKELCASPEILQKMKISPLRQITIMEEAKAICEGTKKIN